MTKQQLAKNLNNLIQKQQKHNKKQKKLIQYYKHLKN